AQCSCSTRKLVGGISSAPPRASRSPRSWRRRLQVRRRGRRRSGRRRQWRLGTLLEWEYAARAGTTTPFSTGQTITTDQANFNGEYTYGGSARGRYQARSVEVGSFMPNAFSLHDMHGNVWEWVEDCYQHSYAGAPTDGSTPASSGCSFRVLRGGSWVGLPGNLRSAARSSGVPGYSGNIIGFRVARTL